MFITFTILRFKIRNINIRNIAIRQILVSNNNTKSTSKPRTLLFCICCWPFYFVYSFTWCYTCLMSATKTLNYLFVYVGLLFWLLSANILCVTASFTIYFWFTTFRHLILMLLCNLFFQLCLQFAFNCV